MRIESVVVLNDFCHAQGGASRVAIDEAIALRALGFEVSFLGAVGPVCAELLRRRCHGDLPWISRNWPMRRAIRGSALRRDMESGGVAGDARDCWRRSIRRRTIVHLHGYTKALSTAPALAARRAGFATICTLHDFFAACPNGAFFDYRRQAALHAARVVARVSGHRVRQAASRAQSVSRSAREPCSATSRDFRRACAITSRFRAVPRRCCGPTCRRTRGFIRWRTSSTWSARRRWIPARTPTLMVVGRLDEEKGVVLAARAAAAARTADRVRGRWSAARAA